MFTDPEDLPPEEAPPPQEVPTRAFVPVELPPEEPLLDRSLVIGLLLALLVNGTLGWHLFVRPIAVIQDISQTIEVAIVEPPPPPPEPEPEPEPPAPPEPKAPKVVDMEHVNEPPPTDTAADPAASDEPPPKPVFGVSMSSTVDTGNSGFKVRVGNTIAKAPEAEITDPSEVKPLREVSFHKLEQPPRLLSDYKAEYPAGPKEEEIEGTVVAKLTIDEKGRVIAVKIIRGIHPELDAAAKAAMFRFRYKPGMLGGEPVITKNVIHRYTWLIEG